mgnify:CR=1 FL=1
MLPVASTGGNAGLILREDASLKAHLQGVTVQDASSPPGGRPVPVYYRLPEQEARRRDYPYITIDLLSIARDASREHRGTYYFGEDEEYAPPTRTAGDRSFTDWPIPLLLTYQVTHFARFVQHDRQLMVAMITDKLLERFGAMVVTGTTEVVDDMSIRRLELVSGPTNADSPDPGDPNKRIFRKAYTVQVSSESFPEEIENAVAVADGSIFINIASLVPVNGFTPTP